MVDESYINPGRCSAVAAMMTFAPQTRPFPFLQVSYIAAALGCCVVCVLILARGW